ncbi:hypothetical protein PRIO_2849 [Paenibacillus riograndensis SBR5]|uniref:Uncharacterized protein n=1 Tax=Paenibacillus riograndensis SBR5 TaxID=1073571 RepID=A0A0E3WHG6_9BACL|nr:hypothetical protein PRIO_2849 [Paenibacillus riograndensis SBR5]
MILTNQIKGILFQLNLMIREKRSGLWFLISKQRCSQIEFT